MTKMRAILCAALSCVVASPAAFACGLNWDAPQSHFPGVSFQGYVFHVESLGEMDLGDGLVLPLRAIFRSESNASSPYVGQGWDIPLLESHIVQINEHEFRMVEPTGWFRLFWRDGKDPTLLHGQNGWKAEIKGNTVTAWADCGGKLVFNAGKITQLQLENRTFDYQYSGNRVSEIREGGRPLLKVDSDPIVGIVNGLSYGEQQIRIELGDKPQVQVINDQSIVASVQKSLSKLTLPHGTTKEFEYAVNEKLQPMMLVGKGDRFRKIVWDSVSKFILSDNDWNYIIKPPKQLGNNAAIERRNLTGEKESYFYDMAKGRKSILKSDGVLQVTTWFTSGKLQGRIRAKETWYKSRLIASERYSYSENGNLLRVSSLDRDTVTIFWARRSDGSKFRISRTLYGHPVRVEFYNSRGVLAETFDYTKEFGFKYEMKDGQREQHSFYAHLPSQEVHQFVSAYLGQIGNVSSQSKIQLH